MLYLALFNYNILLFPPSSVQAPAPNTSTYVEEQKVNGFSRNEDSADTFAQFSKDDFKNSPEQLEL